MRPPQRTAIKNTPPRKGYRQTPRPPPHKEKDFHNTMYGAYSLGGIFWTGAFWGAFAMYAIYILGGVCCLQCMSGGHLLDNSQHLFYVNLQNTIKMDIMPLCVFKVQNCSLVRLHDCHVRSIWRSIRFQRIIVIDVCAVIDLVFREIKAYDSVCIFKFTHECLL